MKWNEPGISLNWWFLHLLESFWKVTDGLSKENCIAAHLFAKQVRQLYRKSGPLSTALYLKQCGVCLQQVYAGPPYEHERLPVFVSLSRNGLPRIIPSFHRKVIMRKDDKADTLVQLYLSFFTLSRVIPLAKRLSVRILDSIVTPPKFLQTERAFDMMKILQLFNQIHHIFCSWRVLLPRYLPSLTSIPLNQGIRWIPTWKAIPSRRLVSCNWVGSSSLCLSAG